MSQKCYILAAIGDKDIWKIESASMALYFGNVLGSMTNDQN